mgnify:CR=1 FL=1
MSLKLLFDPADGPSTRGPERTGPRDSARDVPCEMCESIPCQRACPTGALVSTLADIDDAENSRTLAAVQAAGGVPRSGRPGRSHGVQHGRPLRPRRADEPQHIHQ